MTVELVEATDDDICFGYLTVENVSQEEIEKTVEQIREKLQSEYVDEDDVPCWDLEDFKALLPEEWEWSIDEQYKVGI